jgi:hypothetical protein
LDFLCIELLAATDILLRRFVVCDYAPRFFVSSALIITSVYSLFRVLVARYMLIRLFVKASECIRFGSPCIVLST